MLLEFLADYGWVLWLSLLLIFGIAEMFTLELTSAMFSLGSLGGLVAWLFGAGLTAQIIVACVVTLLLLGLVKRPLLKLMKRGADKTPIGVEAIVGQAGVASEQVDARHGIVKLTNGDTWTARTGGETIPAGSNIRVLSLEGATVIVQGTAND